MPSKRRSSHLKNAHTEKGKQENRETLTEWLESCTRHGKIARNTVATGIVVLDHLRRACPVSRDEAISQGGEVSGARSGLGTILESYDIPSNYLKEVTTRQGHQDGQRLFEQFEWGKSLVEIPEDEREELLLELVEGLRSLASEWLKRQNLKLDIDRRQAPTTWVHVIVENAKGRSGGIVVRFSGIGFSDRDPVAPVVSDRAPTSAGGNLINATYKPAVTIPLNIVSVYNAAKKIFPLRIISPS